MFVDEPGGLRIGGPQVAPGARSVVAAYGPADWDRAVRHGVAPTGRPLMVMPSEDYAGLSDEDFVALVAHLKGLPAVDGRPAVVELPVPVRIAYGLGVMKDAAAKIDHARAPSPPVAPGVTTEYGRYVAMSCLGCHGPKLEGGRIPGAPPDWPPAPRLVPGEGTSLARYPDAASLAKLFATGRRPDGSEVKVMPFEALGRLDEVEVAALHRYLSGAGG
jgi:mono/diheme cytochrome c family protein